MLRKLQNAYLTNRALCVEGKKLVHWNEVTYWSREGQPGIGKREGLPAGVVGPCFGKSCHSRRRGSDRIKTAPSLEELEF